MPICTLIRAPRTWPGLKEPVIATLGNLDGVHLGHQALCAAVTRARERVAGGKGSTIAITFYPHPSVVLGRAESAPSLCSLRQKLELLGACGIEHLVLLRFSRAFSTLRADDFIRDVLFGLLRVQHLVIGPDAHVGFRREGTPEKILAAFTAAGRTAEIVPFVTHGESRVSSRRVRELLSHGELSQVEALLGRSFSVEGVVRRGDGRGRLLGYRTANIATGDLLLPRFAVYAGFLDFLDMPDASRGDSGNPSSQLAVCNIGMRPTFNGERPTVEAHLPEYQGGEFYGRRVRLVLKAFVRSEQKFENISALKAQIEEDVRTANALLANGA